MQLIVKRTAPLPIFPLSVSASGRYLQTVRGYPFFVHGDSAWTLEVQCTHAQIDTYLNNRAAKGFNAILIEAFEHWFSSQTPVYQNAEGNNPFSTMSPTDFSTAKASYFLLIDYILNAAKIRGMVVFIACAYYGFAGSEEGWDTELLADSSAHLQAYGVFLMNRYGDQGNVIWVLGGDNPAGASVDAQIVTGMRSIRTDQIITGHSSRGNDAYSKYSAQTGFNLNTSYSSETTIVSDAATAYGRSMPFVLIEARYENENSITNAGLRKQAYQVLLSGACGQFFGQTPMWAFGSANIAAPYTSIGAAATLTSTYLDTTATVHMSHVPRLFTAYAWHSLVPKTDTSLVTTTLGSGTSAICAALSGTTLAMIYTPAGAGFTVAMTAFSKSMRARWYDPTNGTYTLDSASISNSGTHAFTVPGNNAAGDSDLVLVLD